MMGVSHAVSGSAAGALLLPVLTPGAPVAEKIALVVVTGGWALWPDVDQGGVTNGRVWGSTAARTWGPITALMAAGIGRVADGHRNGTHSLLGVAVFTGLAALATLHPVSTAILVALSVGLALRGASWILPGRREKVWPLNLAVSVGLAIGFVYGFTYSVIGPVSWTVTPGSLDWLPVTVAVGCVAHILGDMLTPERCPLLWPVSKRRFGVGLFTTSTPVEAWVVVPALAAVMVWAMSRDGMLDPITYPLAALAGGPGHGEQIAVLLLALMAGVAAFREHGRATRRT